MSKKDFDVRWANRLYIALVGIVFACLACVMLFFPRTRYSELEKRELATFPPYEKFTGQPAKYTAAISQWFSDSEPFRDRFMSASMSIRNFMSYTPGGDEDAVTFRPADESAGGEDHTGPIAGEQVADMSDNLIDDGNAKVASAGIIIVGKGQNVRALMSFGGRPGGGQNYIRCINEYVEQLPGVNIYAMVIPTAAAFYLPAKAADASKPQGPVIESIYKNLNPKAHPVNVFGALQQHKDEDIYLRTDHHWAPLGGYYAAKELARVAGVPFRDLKNYDRHVVHGYVGSMFGYSHDISVKNAPEDFVYYTPRDIDYTTTYITYKINKKYEVTSEGKPYTGSYFHHYKDGSGAAYCTFMGGDQHTVKVKTGTPGNRKLLIVKDSFGNTLPGYMFYSFSEVHVVDFRYFPKNMKEYVKANGITDVAICFNIFGAYGVNGEKARKFLGQRAGQYASPTASEPKADKAKVKEKENPREKPAAEHKNNSEHKESVKTETDDEPKETPATPAQPVETPAAPVEPAE